MAVKDELKSIGITEMKHAEAIAERLAYLGGTPDPQRKPRDVDVDEGHRPREVRDHVGDARLRALQAQLVVTQKRGVFWRRRG
jgi:bacterioferritin (cytochrome b1)